MKPAVIKVIIILSPAAVIRRRPDRNTRMRKILAADDDPGAIGFYKDMFTDAGYEFKAAHDVTGAVMLCQDFKPDLLVLDWEMPAGGGSMIFEKVRELTGKEIPVIFVTGMPQKVDKAGLPKVVVIQKPASVQQLLDAVARLLEE